MDPITITAIINGVIRLTGFAVSEFPKIQALIARLKGDDNPITIEELDALIAEVDAKNEQIQNA